MTIRKIHDRGGFISVFNDENGDYMRTGILDEYGNDTDIEPLFADFPQLLDIGIMGHCEHGLSGKCRESGIQCYQSGAYIDEPNMPFEDFKTIISQCEGKTFQVALGGRGDSEMHEQFENILAVCRYYGIVPNITTSGYGLDAQKVKIIKRYCGAAAVSWYKTDYSYRAINMLIDAGVTTNIHFVLGENSIDEAIDILSDNLIPKGISRLIFLLHKPAGMGDKDRILKADDFRMKKFFDLMSDSNIAEKTGFDSCLVPGIIENCPNIMHESFDACEAGRFSAYIGADLMMSPCSFDRQNKVSINLKEHTVKEAWESKEFSYFREHFKNSCKNCYHRENCMGGCPYYPEIRLCKEGIEI